MSDRIVFSCDRAEIEGLLLHGGLPNHVLGWSADDHQEGVVENLLQRMIDEEPVVWTSRVIKNSCHLGEELEVSRRWSTRIGGYLVVVSEHPRGGAGILWHVTGETPPPFHLSGRREADSLEQAKADAVKATRALVAVFGEMPR